MTPDPSEPTAEGQDAKELHATIAGAFMVKSRELAEARADLARMKAAMEEARQLIFDDCADDARIHLAAALKGPSP